MTDIKVRINCLESQPKVFRISNRDMVWRWKYGLTEEMVHASCTSTTWRHRKEFLVFNFALTCTFLFQRQVISFAFMGWTEHELPCFTELFLKARPFIDLAYGCQFKVGKEFACLCTEMRYYQVPIYYSLVPVLNAACGFPVTFFFTYTLTISLIFK